MLIENISKTICEKFVKRNIRLWIFFAGSLPELPETTLPKPTAEDVSSSQESEVELESSTEVERGFKHEEHILRSPSEPGASGHGAQGGFGQTTRQNTTPGDLDRVRPGNPIVFF